MVDPLGLTIFIVGIALVVAELAQPGYYVGVIGTVGVVVGLVQMGFPEFLQSWWSPVVVTVVATAATIASIQFYKYFAPPAKAPETLSSDALVGMTGRVVVEVQPNNTHGKVKVGSIVWSAESTEPIPEGADIVVERVEGVHVVVRRAPTTPPVEPIPVPGGF